MGRPAPRIDLQSHTRSHEEGSALGALSVDGPVANEAWVEPGAPERPVPDALRAPSGITARIDGDAIIVSDASGRVVARCSPTEVELIADRRDLVLRAPGGRVRIDAALDVEINAGRDLKTSAGRDLGLSAARRVEVGPEGGEHAARLRLEGDRAKLEARRLDVDADLANATLGVVTLLARRLATRVDTATLEARAYELAASSVVTRAREVLTEVSDSVETRAGSVRSLIRGLFALHSERTAMVSKEDTSIDGKKILLG